MCDVMQETDLPPADDRFEQAYALVLVAQGIAGKWTLDG